MTQFNWPLEIVRNCQWKEMAASAAPQDLSPWSPPKLAAKPDEIAAAEAAVGFSFPDAYKGFLRHANGWNGAYIDLSLFGTPDFLSGLPAEVLKRPGLVEVVARLGFRPDQYVVIGAGPSQLNADVFLLIHPENRTLAGGVVWVDADVISESDRFSSFEEFFLAIIDHNESLAHYVAARARGDGPSR